MKIVLFDIDEEQRPAFHELERDHEVVYEAGPLRPASARRFADAEVISMGGGSDGSAGVLAELPRLRMIAERSTGVDNIDLGYCREHEIRVANVPGYGKDAVAEHVFALMLAISHRLVDAVERARHGKYSPVGLEGFELHDKTLGVVGVGAIGSSVIRIARGFGMNVLAFDRHPREAEAQQLGFAYTTLDEVLRRSDIVMLHVALIEETRHLIGREQSATMKDGAVLINTARGELVDTTALVEALGNGKLSAAGLDVLPQETVLGDERALVHRAFEEPHELPTLMADEVLLRMPNVIVTPHSAAYTREAVRRILDTSVQNIRAFLDQPGTAMHAL